MKNFIQRHLNNLEEQSGQSFVLIAAAMIGLVAFVGIAVDVGFVYARNAQLASSIDAATLAGSTEVRTSNDPCLDTTDADIKAVQFLRSNDMPQEVIDTFSSCAERETIGFTNYSVTATWPVELFFLRVVGFEEVNLTKSATAAYFPLVDIYASRRVEDGALSTSNQSVFGPQICNAYGDPFSPFDDPNNNRGIHRGDPNDRTYHYRVLIPPDYPSNIVRVELFDPDSVNTGPTAGNAEVRHSDRAINHPTDPMPPIESRPLDDPSQPGVQCNSVKNTCVMLTGELDLPSVTLDEVNPFWFIRIDENRGNPDAVNNHGDGSCNAGGGYLPLLNTDTLYELFFYQDQGNGSIARVPLASYSGQTDDFGVGPLDRDYDPFSHQTDMRWTAPGGTPIFDQPAPVPADCNSRSGYSIPGEVVPRCPGQPYSPPGPGRGFEIDIATDMSNIVVDLTTGNRYLYLDVTTMSGASENGFEIWAGPPDYTNSISSDVNTRNVQIINNPNSHSSRGASVFGIGQLPMNSNLGGASVDIPLIYVGPEYAGEIIEVSSFDADTSLSAPPVVFYFDTVAFDPAGSPPGNNSNTDYSRAFAVDLDGDERYDFPAELDPDGVQRNCMPGDCNNVWVTPSYAIQVPTLDPACDRSNPDPLICTPFYGGRLVVRYIAGKDDTFGWEVRLPGLPFLIR